MIPSEHRTAVFAIIIAAFAATLGIGMLIPAIPALTVGLPAVAHGALISAFAFARILVEVPAGFAIDRAGARLSSLIGLGIMIMGALLGLPNLGYGMLMVSVVVQGAGIAIFSTAAMTALINIYGPKGRGTAQTLFQGALLLSYSAGPVVGGYVVSAFGPRAPFAVEALLGLLALPISLLMPQAAGAAKKAVGAIRITAGLASGTVMTFAGFLARITVSWVVVPAVATTMLSLSPQHYGLIIGAGTALNLVFLPLNARLIDSWSASRTVLAASAMTLAGVVLMWLAPVQVALWVGTAFVMIGTSALVTAAATVALEGIPPEQTGAVTGTNRAAGDIGTAIGPILTSGATTLFGLTAAGGFAVTAAVLAVCLVAFAALRFSLRAAPAAEH
ncbi:MFS transporter [Roseixanthobacter pseudopolyaromaticivorans]|uniref:MFS transporter n=1 Tax=Xanthobacteraceae TaxID=335928 RepID=UPI00372C985B